MKCQEKLPTKQIIIEKKHKLGKELQVGQKDLREKFNKELNKP